jgi:hypothetical protein
MEPSTVVLLLLAGVLLLAPSIRKALRKALQRLLKAMVISPGQGRGRIWGLWWLFIASVLVLQAIPFALSLLVATAPVWIWVLLIPLAVFSLKTVWRLNGPWSRQPRRTRLPGRRRR